MTEVKVLGKNLSQKTRAQAIEEMHNSFREIMDGLHQFSQGILHNQIDIVMGRPEEAYKGKSDSRWSQEDIEVFEKVQKFWNGERTHMQKILCIVRDMTEKWNKQKKGYSVH